MKFGIVFFLFIHLLYYAIIDIYILYTILKA